MNHRILALLAGLSLGLVQPAEAQQRRAAPAAPPASAPAAPPAQPAEPPPAAYEPQVMRLAEILGALAYMTDLCRPDGASPNPEAEGEAWRRRMAELLESEAQSAGQKARFAGAYNRGFTGYSVTHRICTPASREAVQGLLGEGARLAHDISNRFGS